ncbi:15800_t:CDS:2, partial [Racocetra fulgida]
CSKYGELWGLARQATQLAVEYDGDNEMKHSITNNENGIPSTGFNNCDNESNLEIANPPVTRRKGRPETKRYKATIERARRQPYTCRNCGQTGHNSARCEKK